MKPSANSSVCAAPAEGNWAAWAGRSVGIFHGSSRQGPRTWWLTGPTKRYSLGFNCQSSRSDLLRRGLSPEALAEAEYRSLPTSGQGRVIERLLQLGVDLRGIPGFAQSGSGGPWRLYGQPGLLIPVRDLLRSHPGVPGALGSEREIAILLALDPRHGARRAGGASSGVPCHVAGRAFLGGRPTLWITEGPLKAEVTSHRLSLPVIGVAGVGNWRKAVPIVREIRPAKVILAFDRTRGTRRARLLSAVSPDSAVNLGRAISVNPWR